MVKNLVVVGNSLALVIDKPMRRFLNIGRNTQVRVTMEPRRLVVEPIPEAPPVPASERDALQVFNMLLDGYGMTQDLFTRLHHQPMRMFAYHGWLRAGLASKADDQERATLRRFYACLSALQRRPSWDDAIAVALHLEPKPGTPIRGEPTRESTTAPTTTPTTARTTTPTTDPTTTTTTDPTTTDPTTTSTTTPTTDPTTAPTSAPTIDPTTTTTTAPTTTDPTTT